LYVIEEKLVASFSKNKKEEKDYDSGDRLSQKFYCVADELIENFSEDYPKLRQCGSSDAMDIYEHVGEDGEVWYDAHCWSCSQVFSKEMVARSSHASELGVEEDGSVKEKKTFQKRPKAEPLTTEEAKKFMKEVGMKGHGYRGISDEANKFYGHLTKVNKQGEVVARYYPETNDKGKIVGFKCRNHPKNFKYGKLGLTGITNQLSGQVRWKKGGGKYCVPMDTQILTKTGWKYYDQLSIGEIVLGYDQNTKTKQWTKVTELHYFEEDDVYSFGSGLNYLRATKDHRWFVEQRVDRGSKGRRLEPQVRTTEEFTSETRLIVNAPFKENNYDLETDVKLSTSKQGDFCSKILSMSHKERVAWLEGFILADGHYRRPRTNTEKVTIEIHQNRGDIFEAALLCSYLVHDKIVRVQGHNTSKFSKKECGKITLSNQKSRTNLTQNMKKVSREPVWCVTTELGSWVMKQGDTINITGNCLIVGGEEDKAATYQMFMEYNRSRGQEDYEQFPIVSPTTGESSTYKQLAAQYDWLDTFDNIYLALDSDKAGKDALELCIDVLPAEKVHIVTWSGKDPNDMLQKGKQKQFIRDFYNAKPYVTDTVKTSKDADDEMELELSRAKIPLPPFMRGLQNIMAGGIPLGYLVNLGAQTGGGKTTIANEMIYYWIFNSPYKVGILTLELNAGQYQTTMLSRHIGHKIQLIEDPKEAVEFVNQPWVKEKRLELREHDNGEPRYVLLDGREGSLDEVRKQIDKLIKKYECKFIVIDPINDLFEGVSLEEQTAFIKYLKSVIADGISIINICHITKGKTQIDKNGNRVVRKLTEDDFSGVSNIAKSGGCNIFATRDKLAEDPVLKNVTEVEVPKCRWTGRSGLAGMWYYDNETHTIHDYEEFFGHPYKEGDTPPSKPKFTKKEKPVKVEEDKPPFVPDNVEDVNPFEGED